MTVQNVKAEDYIEKGGSKRQNECADQEFRPDSRPFFVPPAFDEGLHARPEKHERQQDGQQEDDCGNRPDNDGFRGPRGRVVYAEGALPDQQGEQNQKTQRGGRECKMSAHNTVMVANSVCRRPILGL